MSIPLMMGNDLCLTVRLVVGTRGVGVSEVLCDVDYKVPGELWAIQKTDGREGLPQRRSLPCERQADSWI